jgi:hypothetical protein
MYIVFDIEKSRKIIFSKYSVYPTIATTIIIDSVHSTPIETECVYVCAYLKVANHPLQSNDDD